MLAPDKLVKIAKYHVYACVVLGPPPIIFWANSPYEQLLLFLSIYAIFITAIVFLVTAVVHKEQDTDTEEIKRNCKSCGELT